MLSYTHRYLRVLSANWYKSYWAVIALSVAPCIWAVLVFHKPTYSAILGLGHGRSRRLLRWRLYLSFHDCYRLSSSWVVYILLDKWYLVLVGSCLLESGFTVWSWVLINYPDSWSLYLAFRFMSRWFVANLVLGLKSYSVLSRGYWIGCWAMSCEVLNLVFLPEQKERTKEKEESQS